MVMCDVRDTNAGRYVGLAVVDHGSGLSLCGFSTIGTQLAKKSIGCSKICCHEKNSLRSDKNNVVTTSALVE